MEKMSFVFFIIIIAYLLYSLFKARFQKKEKEDIKIKKPQENQESSLHEKNTNAEKAAIAAVFAAVMGETAFVLKRVYAVPTVEERNSTWRYSGRNEMMTAKKTLKL